MAINAGAVAGQPHANGEKRSSSVLELIGEVEDGPCFVCELGLGEVLGGENLKRLEDASEKKYLRRRW
jgi:hypothetical protein